MSDEVFYVYALVDPRTKDPFYVGKGKGRRCHTHYYRAQHDKSLKNERILELKRLGFDPQVEIYAKMLTEELSLEIEAMLIRKHGRIDLDEGGILTNRCLDSNPPSRTGASSSTAGKTWDEIYGLEKAERMRQAARERVKLLHAKKKGKTLDEYLGLEKAATLREKWSEARKGRVPWNKGRTKADDPLVAQMAATNSRLKTGITLKQRFGADRAAEISKKMGKAISHAKAQKRGTASYVASDTDPGAA